MASIFLAVTMNVSPLLKLELDGAKPSTSALSCRFAARPKLVRVRDGSLEE